MEKKTKCLVFVSLKPDGYKREESKDEFKRLFFFFKETYEKLLILLEFGHNRTSAECISGMSY